MSDPYLPLKVVSASVSLGSESKGWNLDAPAAEGDPERSFLFDVYFDVPFSGTPVVHLGLVGFDIDQCSSSRVKLTAEKITGAGFQARVTTWRSSRVYSVDFDWIAVGS
ncbi:MAG: H-type lectin domain-containing protein [Verrucomicrobiales bacterium]|nr:H-type lectin domain-containing protein [Verrucomicrobiales bacterium]